MLSKIRVITLILCLGTGLASAEDYTVAPEVRAKLEPVLTKNGGELTYFEGPAGMIGVGLSYLNGQQMVVFATADGSTVFSGVAVDIATGQNLAKAEMQNLPPPNYDGVLSMLKGTNPDYTLDTFMVSTGDPDSQNEYFVFFDPKCPYCHKSFMAFDQLLTEGNDLLVHYIPVGILGPESENLAKEILGMDANEGMRLLSKLVGREPHLSSPETVANGALAHSTNLALFRKLQFDAVPVIISDVGGQQAVRRGAVEPRLLLEELQTAQANKVAANKP